MPPFSHFYRASHQHEVLRQCEIISGLIQLKSNYRTTDVDEEHADEVIHPYAIVVTQDCDLEQDYKARIANDSTHRLIPNILFCEMELATDLRGAKNDRAAPTWKQTRSKEINSDNWPLIKQNMDFRYHYLRKIDATNDRLRISIEPLVVDFKRTFSIPTDEVYFRFESMTAERRSVLKSPYIEHFSVRYHGYHTRVALPLDHHH